MSARFLFTCWPFPGHVLPQLSIAAALRERGHEVAFHTGEAARAHVELEGFERFGFEAVDEAQAYADIQRLEAGMRRGRPPARLLLRTFRSWLVETIPAQVADLRAIRRRWPADVIVADVAMWGPAVVSWEADRIPVAMSTIFMGPLIPGPDAPPWGLGLGPPRTPPGRAVAGAMARVAELAGSGLRRRVDRLRADHGLPPMGCTVNEFTGRLPLYLVPSVPELDYGRSDLPSSVHYVGACIWHPPDRPGTEAWLAAVPRWRAWVHVTEGTLSYGDPFLLRAALRGLAGAPFEVIATTGPQRKLAELGGLGPAPPNIHVTDWLGHGELLPRCAAVVTTGGVGTIMAALRAGVPLVVVPTTWDKPDNARRVAEAGVGVRLSPRRCTPARLRAAVELVLGDPSYRTAARRVAARLAEAPGPGGAAKLLEALAPVPALGGGAR
jgi:MGT family glycosyltransferase